MPGNQEEVTLKITGDTKNAQEELKALMSQWGKLGSEIRRLKKEVETGGQGLAKTADDATKAGDASKNASGNVMQLVMSLLGMPTAAKGASGTVMQLVMSLLKLPAGAAGAILGIISIIKYLWNLKNEIIGVVDQAQTLSINLEALATRELVKAGEFDTAAEAMGKAERAATGLLQRLQEIGIESPYTNERVVETFRMAMAYGWASDQAMSLTRSMLDLSAAYGKSGWEMQRIALNLGQIRSKGKIAGQELRDLAGLGVDLNDILRSQLNVSVEQFNAGLKTGKFTMSDFATAIDTYVSTNFAGAAKKLASTVTGIKSSFQDLREIGFAKLFKPLGDVITGQLARGLERLSDIVLRSGWLDLAGKKLGEFAQRVIDAGNALRTKFSTAIREFVGYGFGDVLRDGIYWLRQFVLNLLEIGTTIYGYLRQAFGYLKQALASIGNLLRGIPWQAMFANLRDAINVTLGVVSNMLKSLSALLKGEGRKAVDPLREAWIDVLTLIAVAIDRYASKMVTWGWNLVVNLANGIINAAKAVLVKAMNIVGKIIGWFLKPGSPPKKGPLSHIVEWGRGIIETFVGAFKTADFGVLREALAPVKQALMDAVAAGSLTEVDYLRTYGAAREQVAALIKYFRETGEISADLLDDIYGTLGEGSEELVKYLTLQLQYQRALSNLADIQKEVADSEARGYVTSEQYARLKAAEEEADAIKDQVSWQEEYLALQRESVDIQLQLIEAIKKMAEAAEKLGKEPKAEGGGGEAEMPQMDFESGLDEFIGGIEQLDLANFDEFNQAVSGVSEEFKKMRERVQAFLDLPLEGKLQTIADWLEDVTGWPFRTWYNNAMTFYRLPLEGKLETIAWWLQESTGVPFNDWFIAAQPFMELPLGEKLQTIWDKLSEITGIPFDTWWETITTFLSSVSLPTFGEVAMAIGTTVGGALQSVGTFIETKLLPIWTTFTTFLRDHWWPLLESISNFIGSVFNLVLRFLWTRLQELWTIISTSLQPVWDTLRESFEKMWTVITENLGPILQDLWQWLTDLWTVVSASLKPVVDELKESFIKIATEVKEGVGKALEWLNDKVLSPMVGWFGDIGTKVDKAKEWFQGLADKVNGIHIPSWLEGHSPPPMANWLGSIATVGKEELSEALQLVSDRLALTLGPALQGVTTFISSGVVPVLQRLASVARNDVAPALQSVRDKVAGVLQPVLVTLGSFIGADLTTVFGAFKTLLKDEIITVLHDTYLELRDEILLIFTRIHDLLKGPFTQAFNTFATVTWAPFRHAFALIGNAVENVAYWLGEVKKRLEQIDVPDWAEQHSPSPMEQSFLDIWQAIQGADMAAAGLQQTLNSRDIKVSDIPTFQTAVAGGGSVTIYGGLHFPNVRNASDAMAIRDELQRMTQTSVMRAKVRGTVS